MSDRCGFVCISIAKSYQYPPASIFNMNKGKILSNTEMIPCTLGIEWREVPPDDYGWAMRRVFGDITTCPSALTSITSAQECSHRVQDGGERRWVGEPLSHRHLHSLNSPIRQVEAIK
jgi:hypothetical protein